MSRVITLTGTPSIQGYVYGTNRLLENAGASLLVADAQNWWERELPPSDIVFVGGGNAAFLSDNQSQAQERVFRWSKHYLNEAPGLRLAAAHEPCESGELADAYLRARRELGKRELHAPFGASIGALPLSKICASTGGPAETRLDQQWLSMEAVKKRERARREQDQHPEFPLDLGMLDNYGSAHVALVHADGDGSGERFRRIAEESRGLEDDVFRTNIRNESEKLNDLVREVFETIKGDLVNLRSDLVTAGIIDDRDYPDGSKRIPMRELVCAGDDVTFITTGRIGLAVAARYLGLFESLSKGKVTSSAGVLIMASKFPFSRGYRMVEDLTACAKRARKERGEKGGSWLDFQVLLEGTTGTLDMLRKNAYSFGNHRLLQRPYGVGRSDQYSWESFEHIWGEFQKWPRSQAKRLLETLARGEQATDDLLKEFATRRRVLPSRYPAWEPTNDGKRRTRYFDPLEMLDFRVHVDWERHVLKENAHAQAAY